MKTLFFSFLFVLSNLLTANNFNPNEFTIPKHYKTENTFSGDLLNDASFHLIFAKDKKTKTYKVFTYLFDGNVVNELPSLENNKSYSILTFHQNEENLSLFVTYTIKKKSFLKRIDYNLHTNIKTESEAIEHDDFLTSIRKKNRSLLLYKNDNALQVFDYNGTSEVSVKKYEFNSNSDKVFTFFKDKSVTSIKTDEYVANGSVNDVRLYFENNELIFTRDSDKPLDTNFSSKTTNTTEVLKFNLNDNKLQSKFSVFSNQENIKFKKATSYVFNNKLYQLGVSKKSGAIKVSDINTNKVLNSFALNNKLSKYIKGNNDFQGIANYLKSAGKNKYNATVTVNKTKNNKLRVRVDYVDINYGYNYNWWWHHHFFLMHQQMHMQHVQQSIQRNIPTGFGPRIIDNFPFLNATVVKEKRHFELLINEEGQLLNDSLPDLYYKNIDKKEYIDKLEETSNYEFVSTCFLDKSFRYITFNKKTKTFLIKTEKLNDSI